MKAIIDGKTYNTETAEEICCWHNDERGFSQCGETIYKTKKGNYFLHGEGGAASAYCERVDNGSIGGSKIIVLTEAEVLARLEKWDNSNSIYAIEKYFSHMIEEA
jgi:hypothetical protein